jgi:hypothetical protein
MRIISSSIEAASETFLHAGYVSAYPRSFGSYAYEPLGDLHWDVAEALRLEGETLGDAPIAAALSLNGDWLPMTLGVAVFFGAILAAYSLRERFAVPAVALLGLLSVTCSRGKTIDDPSWPALRTPQIVIAEPPGDPPWKDLERRRYAHPGDATHVILHGIVADAIINFTTPVHDLAAIQDEVALPTTDLTEGEAYALRSYGLDGWGREMRLSTAGKRHTVTSAGADGMFRTEDDISLTVKQCDNESWDISRHVYFIRPHEGSVAVYYHRYPGTHFRYNHEKEARALTGTRLFDFLRPADLEDFQKTRAERIYASASEGLSHEPLIMQRSGW